MHPVLNVAAQQRVHRIALSPIPQAVGKQRKGDSRGAAFAMFAVDRDQRRPGARAIKEAAAVDNAPAEFDRVGDLRHTGPDKIAITLHPNIVERQSEESSALASGGLGEGNGEIGFNRL
jgi:hypothetical protein